MADGRPAGGTSISRLDPSGNGTRTGIEEREVGSMPSIKPGVGRDGRRGPRARVEPGLADPEQGRRGAGGAGRSAQEGSSHLGAKASPSRLISFEAGRGPAHPHAPSGGHRRPVRFVPGPDLPLRARYRSSIFFEGATRYLAGISTLSFSYASTASRISRASFVWTSTVLPAKTSLIGRSRSSREASAFADRLRELLLGGLEGTGRGSQPPPGVPLKSEESSRLPAEIGDVGLGVEPSPGRAGR